MVYAKDATIGIVNSGTTPSGTGNFDFTVGADQHVAPYSPSNSDFANLTFNATIGSTTLTNQALSWMSETDLTATFRFAFSYASGTGGTVNSGGSLIFDKMEGSYTVRLDAPIAAFTAPPSTSGANSIVGYVQDSMTVDTSQPFVTVATIPLNNNTSQLYAQFIGYNGTITGGTSTPTTFTPGEELSGTRAFVSISGSNNGVAGDTFGKDEVLDIDLFTTNPFGFSNAPPTAQATSIFFKFDGIGANEDMVIVLKLFDPGATSSTFDDIYTTRALYVANADILKQGSNLGSYSGIVLDNNDGLVVIESNDYNFGTEHFTILGAQIEANNGSVSGAAVNFNGAVGVASTATGANLTDDTNDTGFKITDIGFITTTTVLQSGSFTFNFQLKDSDGDLSDVQTVTAQVNSNGSITPLVLDLDGDGAEFVPIAAGPAFDYGDGSVQTAWVGKDDGLLAIDLNGSGSVDNGDEIVFGGGGLTDLEGLAATYDSNHDGTLDAKDADFAKFGVWQDANGNGVSDAGEFHTLGELGIVSISLVSDGVAYTAAGGDVTVAGSATYTRADGTTGTVADAAFAIAALDKMEAKTAEVTAASVAATGVLAAAAAVAALPVAAAEVAPAATVSADPPAAAAIQTLPETHETLRPMGDALTSHEAFKGTPAEAASHGDEAPAAAWNLAALADHAASPALAAIVGHSVEAANPFAAAAGFSGDAGQLMDALLAAAQVAKAGVDGGAQHVQDLAAVQEAFGDSQGAALVDAMVDHFAGAQTGLWAGGAEALADLFAANVAGGESFGPAFDLNQMLSDMSAHAAAQV